MKDAPDGKLRCEMARGKYPQYYWMDPLEKGKYPNGRYLKKKELGIGKGLAQKEYDQKVLRILENQEKVLAHFLTHYPRNSIKDLYAQMPIAKRILIKPYVMPDEEFIEVWKAQNKGGMNSFPITNGFKTENGELVRSKSEKMIADKLLYKEIPYEYEAALSLKNYGIVHPDFTILNVRTRKTYYLEHFGMMDNPDYCRKALEKIDAYENNNICVNETLLVTMESSLKAINMQMVDLMIQRYLL